MADKRADQLKEITERLEQGVKDIFTSEMYTKYLLTMSKFHNYSFNNTLLIAMQRPDATLVAGYNACLLYTSPSPRDATLSRMPSSA